MKKIFHYEENTFRYIGESTAQIDVAKTKALKKTVYVGIPRFATDKEPTAKVGKCWFIDGQWTNDKPKVQKN